MKWTMLMAAAAIFALSGAAHAAVINVLSTQATEQSYRELVPEFERATGNKVSTIFTGTLDADKRLASGETYDLLIMSSPSIDQHIKDGILLPGSRVDIARSGVGVAVKKGAPKPDIRSVDSLKRALLAARSVGYSTGPSGNIVMGLFRKLGVLDRIKSKLVQTPTSIFVGSIIASGEAEIGFQQVSELSQFQGIDYVGPLPAEIQEYTTFSSGVVKSGKQQDAVRALVKFLTAPESETAFRKRGMEPG